MKTMNCAGMFWAAVVLVAVALNLDILAAESNTAPNPTGTWKWTFEIPNGQTIELTGKLKLEDGKLTGTVISRDGTEVSIQNAKFQQGEVSFTRVRERDGQTITSRYSGKIASDTIKGKMEIERDGQTQSQEWVAKREGSTATGTWKWSFEIPNGQTLEPSAKLTQDGEKLTGVLTINEQERPISEGTIKNGEISFKVLSKRDDQTVTSKYAGKLSGETIKGKWSSDWTGDVVTRDWEAKRSKQ
jgi:cell division protein YceG involved in septum cleavage